jgi:hypothetical protein
VKIWLLFSFLIFDVYAEQFCTVKNFYSYCGIVLKKEYRIDSVKLTYSPICQHVYLWINTPKGGEENCFICALDSEKKDLDRLVNPTKKKRCGKLYKIRMKDWL